MGSGCCQLGVGTSEDVLLRVLRLDLPSEFLGKLACFCKSTTAGEHDQFP